MSTRFRPLSSRVSPTGRRRDRSTRDRHTYTVVEAAKILGISRTSAYEAVRRGEIPSISIGHRIVISHHAIARLLDGDAASTDDAA